MDDAVTLNFPPNIKLPENLQLYPKFSQPNDQLPLAS